MPEKKIELNDNAKAETKAPAVSQPKPAPKAAKPTVDSPAAVKAFQDASEKAPCNWVITPLEEDQIEARNTVTLKSFQGTMVEFNKLLRG